MNTRKLLRKPLASFLKRYYILVNGGYSVGTAYGARFLFDWRHSLDKKVAVELYEYDQITYLCESMYMFRPDMFLDIGAHAALYSVILKSRIPDLEIHAFEPDKTNLCQLYANLFLNGMQAQITVHEHGISDMDGEVSFESSDKTSSRGTRRISRTGNSIINVKRIDSIINCSNRTIAIKIDVEGHEFQVIDGAMSLLKTNKCFLQIESAPEKLRELKEKMGVMGYKFITTLSDHYFTNIDIEE
jgi:FkbM family methyltransferase